MLLKTEILLVIQVQLWTRMHDDEMAMIDALELPSFFIHAKSSCTLPISTQLNPNLLSQLLALLPLVR